MADLKQVLSEEIRRLARKEIRAEMAPLQQALSAAKKMILEQKRQIASLEKRLALQKQGEKEVQNQPVEKEERKLRLNAAGIIRIRKKLKLTQAEFSALLGVSLHTVSMWEIDRVSPRREMKTRICALRTIGKRELAKRLNDLKQSQTAEKDTASQK